MSSYHSSFTYLNKNSAEEGFIITSFEPNSGFTDSFLGMDQIYEDYYDGTKKFLYGMKYNTSATISITLIKRDGSDFSVADNRRVFRWLTGARTASWLDLYEGDEFRYSFLGTMSSNPQQHKLDGRVIGISIEFASISPWAYSEPQYIYCNIRQSLSVNSEGVLLYNDSDVPLGVDENGLLSMYADSENPFAIDDKGVIYTDTSEANNFTNPSDDLYIYTYLDLDYENISDTVGSLSVENRTIGEVCEIKNIGPKERIVLSGKQFIISYTKDQVSHEWVQSHRIFGDDFNFIWPRIQPGNNEIVISGAGTAEVRFTYRYPMKVGDCAMDISTYGGDIGCGDCGEIPSYNTIKWENITETPTTIDGYGITDAYTIPEVDEKLGFADASVDENELNNMLNDVFGA